MSKKAPDRYLTRISIAERHRRIFIDYLRNDAASTAVAPYSTRSRPGVRRAQHNHLGTAIGARAQYARRDHLNGAAVRAALQRGDQRSLHLARAFTKRLNDLDSVVKHECLPQRSHDVCDWCLSPSISHISLSHGVKRVPQSPGAAMAIYISSKLCAVRTRKPSALISASRGEHQTRKDTIQGSR
jgi:hypothetical protein